MTVLETNLASLELDNPVLSASGTFGSGWEGRQFSDLGMVGGLVSKTVTLKPRPGNPPPRIFETPMGMLNAIGLENKGADVFLRESLPRMQELAASGRKDGKRGPRVIVNLGGSSDELVELTKRFCAAGVDALEINLSCPNVAHGTRSSTDPALTEQVIAAVKAVATVPVFAKLTPNITDVVPIAAAAQRGGADAVTLINTLVGMAVDWRRKKPVLGNITGGLSGPAIKPVALRIVYQVRAALPDLPILAVGGAHSAECVLEFICAGASAVQFGTSLFTDPTLMVRVASELRDRLGQESTSIRELCSAMHQRVQANGAASPEPTVRKLGGAAR
ncbi:MAG: dihydroorotate dehydrogenase (NAD+) catalytic subunit [Planctomycetota bacterium]|jgi:dihydroorotate dehydrogenase (NAD+) catalytic subunit